MQLLVSGASGGWGLATVKALHAKGHEVIGLVHTPSKADAVARAGARPVVCNLNDPKSFEVAKGVDGIIHTAQRPVMSGRVSAKLIADMAEEDRRWTLGLLRAGAGSAKVFVYASGMFVYGDTGDQVVDESSPTHPFFMAQFKLEHEQLTLEEAAKLGYKSAVALRAGAIYGHGVATFARTLEPATQHKKSMWVGSGNQWVSYVHADDVGEASALAVEKQPGFCALNVVDDEPVRAREALTFLATTFQAAKPGGAPRWLVKLFAGHIADALAGNSRLSNARAKAALGWKLTYPTYREGFAALAKAAPPQESGKKAA